jgi:hypothetical protein
MAVTPWRILSWDEPPGKLDCSRPANTGNGSLLSVVRFLYVCLKAAAPAAINLVYRKPKLVPEIVDK